MNVYMDSLKVETSKQHTLWIFYNFVKPENLTLVLFPVTFLLKRQATWEFMNAWGIIPKVPRVGKCWITGVIVAYHAVNAGEAEFNAPTVWIQWKQDYSVLQHDWTVPNTVWRSLASLNRQLCLVKTVLNAAAG